MNLPKPKASLLDGFLSRRGALRREKGEERFRALAEAANDAVISADGQGRITYFNPAAERHFGYSQAEVVGRSLKLLMPERYREAHGAGLQRFVTTGEARLVGSTVEVYALRKDGSEFPAELSLSSWRDAGGLNFTAILRDITQRKRSEEQALEESEARFRRVFELAASGLAEVDLQGRFLRVNPKLCAMLGYTEQELTGRSVKDVSHPDDRDLTDAARRRLLAREIGDAAFEKRYVRKDGTVIWVRLTVGLARDSAGRPEYEIAVIEDITGQKAAQARIERLTRVLGMLSGINAAIVRIRDRQKLFDEVCRISVEAGRFAMVWVGLVDREGARVVPLAWSEGSGAFLTSALRRFSLDVPSPSTLAVSERRPFVSNDVESDPRVGLTRDLRASGIRSVAILPLLVGGEAVGALGLHAAEIGFFDAEEMKLLQDLAGDISFALEHIGKEEKLQYLAYHDPLTGLANRAVLVERLSQCLQTAAREGSKVNLFLMDVERLRTVNESFGRQAGDALLKELGERLARAAGGADRLARISGGTFALFVPDAGTADEAVRRHAERMRLCFGAPFRVSGHEVRTSARAGIAAFPGDGSDAETLYHNAEAALASAKRAKEPYSFYAQAMNERVAERLALESRLRRAIENSEFVLHYQPKVSLAERRITGVEALIRWRSPELGLVAPLRFIPLLEETGLILPVGAWALERAALDHRDWIGRGLSAPRVSVNVSAIQLRQRDFVAVVRRALLAGAAPPGVDLEITETLLMENIEENILRLKEVRNLGINIAIDDFGTGYSSLGYLAKLPLQALKIDRSFVAGLTADSGPATLVSTIISLAHSLGLTVIAEGVENEDQARLLALLRCDEMQGYLISKPLPADELAALLPA